MGVKTRVKTAGEEAFASVVHGLGLDRRWVERNQPRGATILMYHSVLDDENRDWVCPDGSIDAAAFERQIRFLAEERNPISLSALTDMLDAGVSPPAGTVVVTFDDGYLDTLRVAGPILKRYGVPATVFVVSGWVERVAAPWVDRLHAAMTRRRAQELSLGHETYRLSGARQAARAFGRIARDFVFTPSRVRDARLDAAIAQLEPDDMPPRLLMNWGELADWRALGRGYEVGVHTHTHANLDLLDEDQIRDEVSTCAEALAQRLGVRDPHLAYPYGRGGETAARLVREAGCRSAIGTDPVRRADVDVGPFGLTRVDAARGFARVAFMTSGAYPELQRALLGRN